MIINGNDIPLDDVDPYEIGRKLLEIFQSEDGSGIRVEFTRFEQNLFYNHFGPLIGKTIWELICQAVRESGGNPAGLKHSYAGFVFETKWVAPKPAVESEDVLAEKMIT